jgi:predicted nuclease of predicted toxin-antitoxin system
MKLKNITLLQRKVVMDKYILDENLSGVLAKKLITYLNNVVPVRDLALLKFTDNHIWNYAKDNGYTIITKDSDFLYLSNIYGCPPKIIKLNCGNKSTSYIGELLIKRMGEITIFARNSECYMEII